MMTRGNPSRTIDDEVTSIARRYRRESIATLISVCRNERAPAAARATAAAKLLEYSDGRPGAARPVTVADLDLMTPEDRQELWMALFTHYEADMPGEIKELMTAAYVEAMQRVASTRPNRFQRGHRSALIAQPESRRSVRSSLKNGGGSYPNSGEAEYQARTAAQAIPGDDREAVDGPCSISANGTDSPVVSEFSDTDPAPLPRGMHPPIPQHDIEPINHTPVNGHAIHPDVVRRSALPNPGIAMDYAFRGYGRSR